MESSIRICIAIIVLLASVLITADVFAQATQTTVNTTAPVTSETTISIGTLAGQVLLWIIDLFAAPIASMILWILIRVFKRIGIDLTDTLRSRLQQIIVNGLNFTAKDVEERLKGRSLMEIRKAIVDGTVVYAQVHGADTIKDLGLDPHSGAAVQAIKARVQTAVADPVTPTPAVMSNPPPPQPEPPLDKPFAPYTHGGHS